MQHPTNKRHFVTARTVRRISRRLMLILLTALLSGVGIGLSHPSLAIVTASMTFLAGCLLTSGAAVYRYSSEWEWHTASHIRRTG